MRNTIFIRLLQYENKGAALGERIATLRKGLADEDVYGLNPESFRQVPNTPFCYWVSERIRRLFKELPPFESDGRTVKQGLATADDFRFVRAWWEVPAERILDSKQLAVGSGRIESKTEKEWTEDRIRAFQGWCRKRTEERKGWVPFAKGGEYSPYYSDIHLVVNWEKDGAEMKAFSRSVIRNPDYYFRPGLTWTYRTNVGFSVRVKPAGSIHGHVGHSAFCNKGALALLSWFNSTAVARKLLRLLTTYKWEVGYVQNIVVPQIGYKIQSRLEDKALYAVTIARSKIVSVESSICFIVPALLSCEGQKLDDRVMACRMQLAEMKKKINRIQTDIDEIAFDLYEFTKEERQAAVDGQCSVGGIQDSEVHEDGTENSDVTTPEEVGESSAKVAVSSISPAPVPTGNLLSWCVGVVFGRWDIRPALSTVNCLLSNGNPDPFDPLPVCPPGMLLRPDGLPAEANRIVSEEWLRARPDANTLPFEGSVRKPSIPDSEYLLRISWEGVLVDDPGLDGGQPHRPPRAGGPRPTVEG
jgi:hypothetical protein